MSDEDVAPRWIDGKEERGQMIEGVNADAIKDYERKDARDEGPGVVPILAVGRCKRAEHRRQQYRAREILAERRRRDMQRITAAGREAHQDQFGAGYLLRTMATKSAMSSSSFARVIDVAAHAGAAVAANVRRKRPECLRR